MDQKGCRESILTIGENDWSVLCSKNIRAFHQVTLDFEDICHSKEKKINFLREVSDHFLDLRKLSQMVRRVIPERIYAADGATTPPEP